MLLILSLSNATSLSLRRKLKVRLNDGFSYVLRNLLKEELVLNGKYRTNEKLGNISVADFKEICNTIKNKRLDKTLSSDSFMQIVEKFHSLNFRKNLNIKFYIGCVDYAALNLESLSEFIKCNQKIKLGLFVGLMKKLKLGCSFRKDGSSLSCFIQTKILDITTFELLEECSSIIVVKKYFDEIYKLLEKNLKYKEMFWFLFQNIFNEIIIETPLNRILQDKDLCAKLFLNENIQSLRFSHSVNFIMHFSEMESYLNDIKNISFTKRWSTEDTNFINIFSKDFESINIEYCNFPNNQPKKISRFNENLKSLRLCDYSLLYFEPDAFFSSKLEELELEYTITQEETIKKFMSHNSFLNLKTLKITFLTASSILNDIILLPQFISSTCEKYLYFKFAINDDLLKELEEIKTLKVLEISLQNCKPEALNTLIHLELKELSIGFNKGIDDNFVLKETFFTNLEKLSIKSINVTPNLATALELCNYSDLVLDVPKESLRLIIGKSLPKTTVKNLYIQNSIIGVEEINALLNLSKIEKIFFINCHFEKYTKLTLNLNRRAFIKMVLINCKNSKLIVKNINHLPITLAEFR